MSGSISSEPNIPMPQNYADYQRQFVISLETASIVKSFGDYDKEFRAANKTGEIAFDTVIDPIKNVAVYTSKIWDGYDLRTKTFRVRLKPNYPVWDAASLAFIGSRLPRPLGEGCRLRPISDGRQRCGADQRAIHQEGDHRYVPLGKFNTLKYGIGITDPFLAQLLDSYVKELSIWIEDAPRGLVVKTESPDGHQYPRRKFRRGKNSAVLKLILNNVLKHKVLYILIGLVVALLSFYVVIGLNTVFSVSSSLERAIAENMTGDLIIASPEATSIDLISRSRERGSCPWTDGGQALAFVARPAIRRRGRPPPSRARDAEVPESNYLPIVLTGVDPARERGLLPRRKLDEGDWVSGPGQINLYYRHADLLSASVGDVLGVTVTTRTGYARFETLRLVGNLDYSDVDYYSEFAYGGFVTLDYLNGLLMSEAPLVSEIHVRLGPGRQP